ncbi:MAG: outer membrane protein assembly factor BamD [Thermodesulfobacteriales bacterium]|nr:MAG: outer membrane protein assembly factor BamD [Thermodesulfobacteriales bacterium]
MNRILTLLFLAFSLMFVVNCGSRSVPKGLSDQELYEGALEQMNEDPGGFPWIFNGKDHETILKYLKEVQLRYTYSPYATLAELRTGDVFFEQGDYEQAAVEYEEFIKRHPGHQEASYATYQLAISYYRQILSPDRDPTTTREALKWFNIFIEKYPDSPLVAKAEQRVVKCRQRLAKREIYIGNFYNKRKNYKAAVHRYGLVVADYSDTKQMPEAMYLLGRAYAKQDQYDLARATLNQLVQTYPDEKYAGKASSLLNDIEGKTPPVPEQTPDIIEEPSQG